MPSEWDSNPHVQAYSAFQNGPTADALTSDAGLHYITTTTNIDSAAAVIKHLSAQSKQVTRKDSRILSAVQGQNSLFLETEVTLQFNNGGGAWLPSMDENLLDEKMVNFPLLHIVTFDEGMKIKQIRLHWDSGTLLKQVEAIGKTGRNWPIRDGAAQINAIHRSVRASGNASSATGSSSQMPVRQHNKTESISATRDPHASLNLFAPRDPNESAPGDYQGPRHAPRASAKPPPRDYTELFANGEEPPVDPTSKIRSPSPSKAEGVFAKAGAGTHYARNRLFDDEDDHDSRNARSPERKKVFNQKYDHFSFGDGEDAPQSTRPASNSRGSKGASTFSFEDFSTPPKVMRKARPDEVVHWGAEDDPPTPPKRPIVHAARPDADAHFSFDAPTPDNRPKSQQRQAAMNLYHDPVFGGDEEPTPKSSSTNQTSTNTSRRGDDFGAPHYRMTDQDENTPPAASSKRSTRSDMEQHWTFSEPKQEQKIYKTAGDGMGGRLQESHGHNWRGEENQKIYKTAGDGMGGRTGGRGWSIGDEVGARDDEADKRFGRGRRAPQQAGPGAAGDF